MEELNREENLQPASEVALISQRVRWSSLETPVRGTGRSSGSPIPGRRRGSSSSDSPSPRSRRWSPPRREECWRCRGRSTSPLERRREQSERRRSSGERPPGRGDPGGRLRSPSPGPAGRAATGGERPRSDARRERGTSPVSRGETSAPPRSGTVRCWSCGGIGHIKRQCPNGLAGGCRW